MSQTQYKKNWAETKEHFEAWWAQKNEQPILILEPRTFYMNSQRTTVRDFAGNWRAKWADTANVIEQLDADYSAEPFIGDEFPFYSPYLGPGSLAAHMGAPVSFGKDTIWFEPCSDDIEQVSGDFTDPEHWWDWSLSAIEQAKRTLQGRMHVSIPDIEIGLDIISALISPTELLYALMDSPSEVHRLQKQVLEHWKRCIRALYDATKDEDGFSSYTHFYIMGKGIVSTLQCDFGTMISPQMFEEFMLPYLREYAKFLDRNIYHLDGVDNVRNLDLILSVPEVQCIQWTPGAGKPDGGDPCWDEIYKKALDHGKNIYALMSADKVEPFLKRFGKRGVYVRTDVRSAAQAEELIERVRAL